MLQPTTRRRERILAYGLENGGKSTLWLQLAAWLRRTNSSARVFAMDSDMVSEWAPDAYPGFDENVRSYDTYQWEEYRSALDEAQGENKPDNNDWLVVDTSDRPWLAVQDWYVRTVKEVEVENWIVEHAKSEHGKEHPLSGEWGMNWFYINDQYNRWFQPIIRWKGHVLICAHERKLVREGLRPDDRETIQLYDKVGVRPEGQKGLSLPMHTILRLTDTVTRGKHDRKMYVVKNKVREEDISVEWEDFVTDFLIPYCKWEI